MDAPRGGAKEKKWIASILIWIQHFQETLDLGPESVLQYAAKLLCEIISREKKVRKFQNDFLTIFEGLLSAILNAFSS